MTIVIKTKQKLFKYVKNKTHDSTEKITYFFLVIIFLNGQVTYILYQYFQQS